MNVFILCTGRTGSTAIIQACKHITNYTAKHESITKRFGTKRFDFPDNHIEADNRLSWKLGLLEKHYGDDAFYVHLKRDRDAVAKSFMSRFHMHESMIDAFCEGIHMKAPEELNERQRLEACYDYIDTVNTNIEMFLNNKMRRMTISIENIEDDFQAFWQKIGATGNLDEALAEFQVKHNATRKRQSFFKHRLKLLTIRQWRRLNMRLKS